MISTLERKMWSNDSKASDKTAGRVSTRIPVVRRDPTNTSVDQSLGAYPRNKTRSSVTTSVTSKTFSKPRDRYAVRKTSDVLKVSESDVLGRRKPKKTKKDSKPFPGKIYREKTFGVFSTPNTSDYERPSNVPRRRLQTDESDTLDRGYVSDVKSEITRSFYQEKEDEFKVDRRIRPKSAGQALYHADSDDDSSLDGEIEVIDIDNDDTFIVIQDTTDSYQSNLKVNTNFVSDQPNDRRKSLETVGHSNRYYGNTENTSKHGRQMSGSELEKRDGRHQLENNPPDYSNTENTLSPATFDRRRVKSDSSAVPLQDNYLDERRETFQFDPDGSHFMRKSNSVNERQRSNLKSETTHQEISSDKTYARAMENVLTKYSNMNVRGGTSSESSHPARYSGRTGENHLSHGQRTSLPRKLKPLLNREKLG